MNNEGAIEFYQKFGFKIVETKEQYYKRIEPAGAHVLEKNLRVENKANNNNINSENNNSQTTEATNGTANHMPNGIDHHHQTKSKS